MSGMVKELKYALFLIFHPFKGFWGIKHENKGSMRIAMILLGIFTLLQLAARQFTSYIFNENDTLSFNVVKEIAIIFLIFGLWAASNWCLTCLMDGEGNFRDIVKATSYALIPMIVFGIPLILLSYALTAREGSIYMFLYYLPQIWTGSLLVLGTMTTHQYTLARTLLTTVMTLLGMAVMAFIGLLFFNLIQQILGFGVNLYKEIVFRF